MSGSSTARRHRDNLRRQYGPPQVEVSTLIHEHFYSPKTLTAGVKGMLDSGRIVQSSMYNKPPTIEGGFGIRAWGTEWHTNPTNDSDHCNLLAYSYSGGIFLAPPAIRSPAPGTGDLYSFELIDANNDLHSWGNPKTQAYATGNPTDITFGGAASRILRAQNLQDGTPPQNSWSNEIGVQYSQSINVNVRSGSLTALVKSDTVFGYSFEGNISPWPRSIIITRQPDPNGGPTSESLRSVSHELQRPRFPGDLASRGPIVSKTSVKGGPGVSMSIACDFGSNRSGDTLEEYRCLLPDDLIDGLRAQGSGGNDSWTQSAFIAASNNRIGEPGSIGVALDITFIWSPDSNKYGR